jgi:hypothetical protein
MTSLLATAEAFFRQEGWAFERAKDEGILRLGFSGQSGRWLCFVEVKEALSQVVFVSTSTEPVEKPQVPAVAEFLMRLNSELVVGGFDLDYDTGHFRFRTALDSEGSSSWAPLFKNIVMLNVASFDRFAPGVKEVQAGASPKAVAARLLRGL